MKWRQCFKECPLLFFCCHIHNYINNMSLCSCLQPSLCSRGVYKFGDAKGNSLIACPPPQNSHLSILKHNIYILTSTISRMYRKTILLITIYKTKCISVSFLRCYSTHRIFLYVCHGSLNTFLLSKLGYNLIQSLDIRP